MRAHLWTICVLAMAGCTGQSAVQCEENGNCNLTGGGVCHAAASGGQWCAYPDPACPGGLRYSEQSVGDGLAGQCISSSATDGGIDAEEPSDGPPANVVDNYQNADLVIGQTDFDSWDPNAGGGESPTAKTLQNPDGICSDGANLYIADSGNWRMLAWNPAPPSSFADAQRVIGKASFTDGAEPVGITASNLDTNTRCSAAGGKLVVSDASRHRVLVWNPAPTGNGEAADLVLGPSSFTEYTSGATTQSLLKTPFAVWTDGTRLVVADAGNHRVLIWNAFPTANGQAADLVLGQSNFTTGTALTPPTASSLKGPSGVYSDGTRLFVTDMSNNRVLIWNSFPETNNQVADVVLGQADFTSNAAETSATAMRFPQGIVAVADALFVADKVNDRVLVFSPIPTASGTAATYVLGQPDLVTGANNPAANQKSLNEPTHLTVVGESLFVTDKNNHRVLRYSLDLP